MWRGGCRQTERHRVSVGALTSLAFQSRSLIDLRVLAISWRRWLVVAGGLLAVVRVRVVWVLVLVLWQRQFKGIRPQLRLIAGGLLLRGRRYDLDRLVIEIASDVLSRAVEPQLHPQREVVRDVVGRELWL